MSVQLPFAIVPLIKFTSNALEMKTFVNPIWVQVLAWISAGLIIALNLWLVGDSLYEFYQISEASRIVLSVIFTPLCIALLALLAYLIFRYIRTSS